jgi:8-amino-7-oxononanoate synthase
MTLKFIDKLEKTITKGAHRELVCTDGLIDFLSNDYLGCGHLLFAENEFKHSGTGSRLISGNSNEAVITERFLATLFDSEKALVFNSGYDTNVGFFSSVPQRGEVVLYDAYIHASIRDGIRLGLANSFSFKHNSLDDLEKRLIQQNGKNVIIAIESYYSMDGDFAPIQAILDLATRYKAVVVIDEAHAVGVFGEKGLGLSFAYRSHPALLARIITFGKAYGAHGGAVLGSEKLIDYLVNFARSFIYTTAMPTDAYERIRQCVEYVSKQSNLRERLTENIARWNSVYSGKEGPIQTINIPDVNRLKLIVNKAMGNGLGLKGVWSPTVPVGEERLRICLHAHHSESDINKLISFLKVEI